MEFQLYCVRDEKQDLSLYGALMMQENDAIASRSFAHEVMKNDSVWSSHPSDFSLWCVGSYDMSCGVITPESPRKVADAADFIGRSHK